MNLNLPLSAVVILLAASLGLTAQAPPTAKGAAPAASTQDKSPVDPLVAAQSKARSKALKAEKAKAKAAPKVKLVDINSASKDELQAIPGVTEAFADKIIAGRPYFSKAHLVTHDVITAALYDSIKKRIYAQQKLPVH